MYLKFSLAFHKNHPFMLALYLVAHYALNYASKISLAYQMNLQSLVLIIVTTKFHVKTETANL